MAPICYVYSDPIHLYFIFRKLFMTYFYKLTIISCDPQSILGLCVLFENFLQCKDPKVFNHLRKLDVQPLSIVFKWLVRCYSGFLASSQVLELWDRILAFNSLEILSSLDFISYSLWFHFKISSFYSIFKFLLLECLFIEGKIFYQLLTRIMSKLFLKISPHLKWLRFYNLFLYNCYKI